MKRYLIALILYLFIIFPPNNAVAADINNPITFGTVYFSPPFIYSDKEGPYAGFDIDFVRALCTKLTIRCRFVPMPLTKLFTELKAGNIDAAISNISITEERKQNFIFSTPYFKSSSSYLILTKNISSNNLLRLKGKIIGVEEGSTFQKYLTEVYGTQVKTQIYPDGEALIEALSASDIDLAFVDTLVAQYWIENSRQTLAIIGEPIDDPIYFGPGYGIIINKNNTILLKSLNSAMTTLNQDGTYQTLIDKYFTVNALGK